MKGSFTILCSLAALVDATALVKRAVGASTSLSSKSKICSILDYGGVADGKTDISNAISTAFTQCVSGNAATLLVPEGDYSSMGNVSTVSPAFHLTLHSGCRCSPERGLRMGVPARRSDHTYARRQLQRQCYCHKNGNDIEFYSSNNRGAINGQGYLKRKSSGSQNARLLRFIKVTNLAVHNLILIDSPTFHLFFNEVSNLEAYYLTIRGPDIGGTDGINLICTDNCYLHDFEVTNRDECVSVKTPSQNVLIEDAYCNHSGGMSIGSLTADIETPADRAAVSNITMRNIYSYKSTQMLMIKTFPGGNGAEGYVKDSLFEKFWSYDCTYGLDIDQYWYSHTTPNTGAVALSGLTFTNWTGHVNNGVSRGPVVIRGSDQVPLTDITLTDINMWTLNGNKIINQCKNVYGSGSCVKANEGQVTTYTTSQTVTATPTAYTSPASPTWAVEGYGTTDPIPIYTPTVWWPLASTTPTAAV